MLNKIVQGFRPDEPDERDHIFGSGETPHPVILESGNWNEEIIAEEFQATHGFENYGCVTWTLLNGLEKLAKLQFADDWNKAERFTYIASGTDPAKQGNSPRIVADSIRNKGVLDEKDLPFDDSIDTFEKFNSPRPLTQNLLLKAQRFLNDYVFQYDFLNSFDRASLKEALKRSPIGVGVYAWVDNDGVYYRPQGADDVHLTLLTNVKDNGELNVFDSYPPAVKTLSADFPITYGIRLYLRKKTDEEKAEDLKNYSLLASWLKKLVELYQALIAKIKLGWKSL